MKNFSDLIALRRSSRKFTSQPLSGEAVEQILRAGLIAPSSKNKHSARFIVVEERESLERLAECKPHGGAFLAQCQLAIVVAGDIMVSDAWIEDASIASVMMQLQAEDLGLGSCWCQVRGRETEEGTDAGDYVRRLLNIPYQLEVLSIIAFGYKEKSAPPTNEDDLTWEHVHLETFRSLSPEEAQPEE